jgi:hypothetical protein
MLTQPPITLVPPNSAVVTKEWSCTTDSTTCLREWEGKTFIILNILFMFLLYTLSPIHLLSVHYRSYAIIPLLHLSNITHPVTHSYISPLPTILRLLLYSAERSSQFFFERLIHIYEAMGSQFPPESLYIFTFLKTSKVLNIKDEDCQYKNECRA